MTEPDYKTLLERYMAFIVDVEGTSFLHKSGYYIKFTEQERAQLHKIQFTVLRALDMI